MKLLVVLRKTGGKKNPQEPVTQLKVKVDEEEAQVVCGSLP